MHRTWQMLPVAAVVVSVLAGCGSSAGAPPEGSPTARSAPLVGEAFDLTSGTGRLPQVVLLEDPARIERADLSAHDRTAAAALGGWLLGVEATLGRLRSASAADIGATCASGATVAAAAPAWAFEDRVLDTSRTALTTAVRSTFDACLAGDGAGVTKHVQELERAATTLNDRLDQLR